MIATGVKASLTLRVRSYDDTLCPDNGGGSGVGYSPSILPVQLGGPFHLCNWIGLAAPSVRLSDQRRVRCTLPRQRLCERIYTQLSSVCQGSDCTTQLLLYSCNEQGRLTGTKKGRFLADKRPTNPYSICGLSDVIWPSCVLASLLAHLLSHRHSTRSVASPV